MNFTKKALMSVLAAGLMVSPAATLSALAQQETAPQAAPTQTPTPAPAPGAVAPVDEAKLRSFAVAFLEVNKVAQTYKPQFDAAKDDKEKQRIQAEATKGMAKAVESSKGITVEEYNQIVDTAQTNPDVAQQINTYLREAVEAARGGNAPAGTTPQQ